jgi:hypothetical protein
MKLSITQWTIALAERGQKANQARQRAKQIHDAQLKKTSFSYSREGRAR